jgi:hypothetical protein
MERWHPADKLNCLCFSSLLPGVALSDTCPGHPGTDLFPSCLPTPCHLRHDGVQLIVSQGGVDGDGLHAVKAFPKGILLQMKC